MRPLTLSTEVQGEVTLLLTILPASLGLCCVSYSMKYPSSSHCSARDSRLQTEQANLLSKDLLCCDGTGKTASTGCRGRSLWNSGAKNEDRSSSSASSQRSLALNFSVAPAVRHCSTSWCVIEVKIQLQNVCKGMQ